MHEKSGTCKRDITHVNFIRSCVINVHTYVLPREIDVYLYVTLIEDTPILLHVYAYQVFHDKNDLSK